MHIVLFKPTPYNVRKNTQFKALIADTWELVLDIPAEESPPFGLVEWNLLSLLFALRRGRFANAKDTFVKSSS